MDNPLTSFMGKTKGLTRNPLGIIALFVSLIYGFACLVLSTSLNNLEGLVERLPLIWFIIVFPCLILLIFTFLVIYHHKKLYAPGDYKDEKNFVNAFIGNKEISSDLENLNLELNTLKAEKDVEHFLPSLNKISDEIKRIKEKSENISINSLWKMNHWGSECASLIGDRMYFTGTSAPKDEDGSHIDLNNILDIGKTYEISCFARSDKNTNGMFQLWCHDKIGVKPDGSSRKSKFKTPNTNGEKIMIRFHALYNKSIRIHLQYKPGQGGIEISNLKISEIKE